MPIKHPDYDIDFKPAIASFDWDQTYDVLEFVYLPQGFSSLIDLCGIPAFERMAIDRFTPYKYRWADQYSEEIYYFLKRFNFSPHNAINERFLRDEAGNLIKDENDNTITVPAFELENTQVYNYSPILANFSEGKYQITGLIYQGDQEGLSGSIPTINQAFTEFSLTESREIDLNKIIWNRWLRDDYSPNANSNRFCSNSLVISKLVNGNWVDYTPSFVSKPEYLLYSDSTAYFSKIETRLVDYFQRIYDDSIGYFTDKLPDKTIYPLQNYLKEIIDNVTFQVQYIKSGNSVNVENGEELSGCYEPVNNEPFFTRTNLILNDSISQEINKTINIFSAKNNIFYNYIFEQFEVFFINLCYLAIANNNKWSTGVNYGDLGFKPIAKNTYLSIWFDLHNTFKIKSQVNLPLYRKLTNNNYPNDVLENVIFARKEKEFIVDNLNLSFDYSNFALLYQILSYRTITSIPFYCSGVLFNSLEVKSLLSTDSNLEQFYFEVDFIDTCYIDQREQLTKIKENNLIRKNNANNLLCFYPFTKNAIIYLKNILFTQAEWEELYNYNAMSDQEYLDYLLQLKEQKESQ